MSNLNVIGTLKENGYNVMLPSSLLNCSSFDTLYSSNSVSTGDKTISGNFSDYELLVFGMYQSDSAGYITTAMPSITFLALSESWAGSLGIWVEQNMSNANRRVCLLYKDDTTFNIRYVQRADRLRIWGIKKYS